MRAVALLVAVCAIAVFVPLASGQVAIAKIFGTDVDPTVTGYVKFTFLNNSHTEVHVNISGITVNPDAEHGVHIHNYGDISHVNGTKAGPHWVLYTTDPDNPCLGGSCTTHGCPETHGDVRHAGDMGNWQAVGGVINQKKELTLIALSSKITAVGHAVILHQNPDDCSNVTATGNAGARLGQGVIGLGDGNTGVVDATIHTTSNPANSNARFVCVLRGTTNAPGVSGMFVVDPPSDTSIRITGFIKGLNTTVAGTKWGVHVHQFGDLVTKPDGLSAGSHFNPGVTPHALPPTATRHVGDLGNIYVVSNGVVWYQQNLPGNIINYHLGPNSLLGRALILHSMEDDGCTQATGNAGSRLAWCVWGVSRQPGNPESTDVNNLPSAAGTSIPYVPPETVEKQCTVLPPERGRGSAASLVVSISLIFAAVFALFVAM